MIKHIILLAFFIGTIPSYAQMPDIELKDINQEYTSLADLAGEKLTVIDYWATWCKPCVASIPKINALYKELKDQGVNFIGINTDGPRSQAKVKPFSQSLGIAYPIILDPDREMVREFNVQVYPTLIVLNSHGEEVFVHEGYSPGDEKKIKEELIKLLDK